MKKILRLMMFIILIFFFTYIVCSYVNKKNEIYINIDDNSYGVIDNKREIDRTQLYYFNGKYKKTNYKCIEEISSIDNIKVISLNEKYHIDEIYIVCPKIRIYVIYDELIYEKKEYKKELISLIVNYINQ
ncbi:MAG: hypothetical protein J6J44_09750 [Lachnospiraceae bacterium]|nr:hypothetical protein [Lachnospiraceae bacterium]